MKNILTFIIPVRHPDNAADWQRVKRTLGETIRSLAHQDAPGWKAVIVANHGADLPDLPPGFEVKRVDFPPNPLFERGWLDKQSIDVFRMDKGRRVLAGMLHAGEMGHVMIVDDDDFVSRRLTSLVAAHPEAPGWYFRVGYAWTSGSRLLYRLPDFSRWCGTSHIIRADLYRIPSTLAAADETYVRRMLGAHIYVHEHLDASGTPLAPLPFLGAVYRVGHAESSSRSKGVLGTFLLNLYLLKNPVEWARRLTRVRIRTRRIEEEFSLV